MSKKGKRGVAKCNKKLNDPDKHTIEFNENGLAIGDNAALFKSWIGIEFRKKIPYHLLVKEVDKKLYNDLWEHIKVSWNIPNDDAKSTVMKEGKSIMRNFRHTLVNKYVNKGRSPFEDYEYLDRSKWDSFVTKVLSKEYQEKSQKAKISAENNTDPARIGRMGYAALMNSWEERWKQLVSSYPYLSQMQDERSKIYTVSRAHYNPVTKLRELGPHLLKEGVLTGRLQELHAKEKEMMENGTYYEFGKDVVTEVVGKGRQHGGRTRLVSSVIGSKSLLSEKKRKRTKEAERVREEIDAMESDQCRVAAAALASLDACQVAATVQASSDFHLSETEHVEESEMMENDTYYDSGKDVTEVVSKGRQHGGRTRLVSDVIGSTKNLLSGKRRKRTKEAERVKEQIVAMETDQCQVAVAAQASSTVCLPENPVAQASSDVHLQVIKSISTCDLIWPFNDDCPDLVLAHGLVYPTSERTLHGKPIHDDYVKVLVDLVKNDYMKVPVPLLTKSDKVTDMESTQGTYIQWPRKAIKLRSSLPITAMPRDAGPWGAGRGKPWDDGVFSTVKQVRVHLGELNVIYALQFKYLKRDGKSVLSQLHGETYGSKIELVDLDGEEEFLTGISGFYGPIAGLNGLEAITSISFHTNKRIHGPYGEENDAGYSHFSSAASSGKVVGFHGKNNRFCSAIGLHMEYF